MKNLLLLLLPSIGFFTSCAPVKPLRSGFNYQKGYSITLRQTIEVETTTELFGEKNTQLSVNEVDYKLTVSDVLTGGKIKWETVVTRFYNKAEGVNGVPYEFDSSVPGSEDSSDIRARVFRCMVGHPMTMTSTSDGHLLEFSGADAMFDKINGITNDLPAMETLLKSVKQAYGDSAMLYSFQEIWGPFPNTPKRVGQKWKVQKLLPGVIKLNSTNVYTLKSRNTEKAEISIKSTSKTLPAGGSFMDMGFALIVYNMSGNGSGYFVVSQPQGIPQESKVTVLLSGNMKVKANGTPEMNVPITTRSTVTLKLLH